MRSFTSVSERVLCAGGNSDLSLDFSLGLKEEVIQPLAGLSFVAQTYVYSIADRIPKCQELFLSSYMD
jgi:hypothetical protein